MPRLSDAVTIPTHARPRPSLGADVSPSRGPGRASCRSAMMPSTMAAMPSIHSAPRCVRLNTPSTVDAIASGWRRSSHARYAAALASSRSLGLPNNPIVPQS